MGDNRNNSYDSRYLDDHFFNQKDVTSVVFLVADKTGIDKIQEGCDTMAQKKNGTASAENDNNANLDLGLNLLAMAESVVDNEPDYNIDNIPEAEKEKLIDDYVVSEEEVNGFLSGFDMNAGLDKK